MEDDDVIVTERRPSSLVYCMIALSSNVGPELNNQVTKLLQSSTGKSVWFLQNKPWQQWISFKYRTQQVLHISQSAQAEGDHCTGSLQADESTSQPNPTATEETQTTAPT